MDSVEYQLPWYMIDERCRVRRIDHAAEAAKRGFPPPPIVPKDEESMQTKPMVYVPTHVIPRIDRPYPIPETATHSANVAAKAQVSGTSGYHVHAPLSGPSKNKTRSKQPFTTSRHSTVFRRPVSDHAAAANGGRGGSGSGGRSGGGGGGGGGVKRGAAEVRPRMTDYNLHQQAHKGNLNFLPARQQAAMSRAAKLEAARREAAQRRKAPAVVHRDYTPVYENEFTTISSLASVMHRPADDATDNDVPW